jgi:hypothetical protein
MAESYSTSLKLTIIGAGDLAGTWGNVTNTNLGTLLEQAITGVQAINISGLSSYTLTNINGSLDDARNAVLIFQNATQACTIVCPGGSANKVYAIVNQGSYNIVMSAFGGSQTLTIPAGMTAQVYLDGLNATGSGVGVYSLLNGVPGSFTVNGNLTATGVTDVGNLSVTGTTTLTGVATAPTPAVGDNSTKIATTAFVQGNTTSAVQAAYPVGSIYMNASNSTNPATLLGFGTWSALGAGQMLLGNGGGYTAGSTGGSATTTLSTANLPAHSHSITDPGHTHTNNAITDITVSSGIPDAYPGSTYALRTATINSAFTGITTTNNTGSGTAVTTISPYLVVYMWQRTA